ncbi:MAG: class I SAM-dependent methyltransferase, partial [Pseudomonadota bacterium]|nr:class I SAM-dependent methyltransferase [Pseudomonadota bacterium]
GLEENIEILTQASASDIPCPNEYFDGIIESCVFQHLPSELRIKAFSEVVRLLKPGGLFIGHMLSRKHSTFKNQVNNTVQTEPGTLILNSKNTKERINLEDIGLAHFFAKKEYKELLRGCSIIDPCESLYRLPKVEASRRGYDYYQHAMWIVYAVK